MHPFYSSSRPWSLTTKIMRVGILIALPTAAGAAPTLRFVRQPAAVEDQAPVQLPPVTLGNSPEESIAPGGRVQTSAPTLSDLESMALQNNPTLAQAAARIQAARGRCIQAGLYPNPRIGYQGTEIGNEGRAGLQGGFIGQEIVTGNKLGLARAVTRGEIAQAQQDFEAQRLRVLNDVRIEFYNVLAAQRTLELSGELVSVGERSQGVTEQLLKAKEVSQTDVLQARVEVNMARIAQRNAENRFRGAWRRLAAVAGVPTMTPTPLAGDLNVDTINLNWDESLARLIGGSPEIAAARAGVQRANAALARAQVQPIPNLDLELGAQYDNATQDTVANVQIAVPVPVHNRNQGAIREAQAQLRLAQAEVGRVELVLQERLALAFEQYSNARRQVDLYSTQILPDARQSLELAETAFRGGEYSFLAYLTAQRTYFQTNLAYIRALNDLREGSVVIEGMLLTGSLREDFGNRR
jgi:outer membrane protein, heavy metal efflux system